MKFVIGSGPAGTACAHALLARGEDVTMLDAGTVLDGPQSKLLDEIRLGRKEALPELAALQSLIPLSSKGVRLKLAYGSAFPYQGAEEFLGFSATNSGLLPSLALGGLSNVWGAAVLPYRQSDISDWPIRVEDLAEHYAAVAGVTGLSGREDDLAGNFPLYTNKPTPLKLSEAAQRVLAGLEKYRGELDREQISFGQSRLMIGPSQAWKQPCVYCGQCLYGCPYGCIYNSAEDVRRFDGAHAPGRFAYRSNFVVEKLTESQDGVSIFGRDRVSGEALQVEGSSVYLGAGVIPTARIMLKSLEAYNRPLLLRDSQYFLLPLLSLGGSSGTSQERLHTLSQLFLEIEDHQISPFTIHLQVYTYNDIFAKVLRKKLWFAPGLRELLIGPMQHRFLLIQGYLHSRHSGTMKLQLQRQPGTHQERLQLEGEPSSEAAPIIHRVINKLKPFLRRAGLRPLLSGLDITLPGKGFHSGGSFPMRTDPRGFETDCLGRPSGMTRVHLVDASVFPSIPATTITFTAMANAHRIASHRGGLSP